jgi:Zn-finger nucleic acid-binding protein
MDPLDFRGIHLDDCPQCGGVWFDDGELNELKNLGDELAMASLEDRAAPAGGIQVVEQKSKMCPVCNERLTPFKYMYTSELVLDECDN